MSDGLYCDSGDHTWETLDRSAFTSTNVLIEAGLVEIPIAEVFLPTHRCGACGVGATIVVHDGSGPRDTLY